MVDSSLAQSLKERILVLDFGSQYTQLIARRIRETGVFSEVRSHDIPFVEIARFKPTGIVLSGGPATVTEKFTAKVEVDVLEMGIPVLGICYGMQTMVDQLGGQVENSNVHEYGATQISTVNESLLLSDLVQADVKGEALKLDVWMSHGDRVIQLPDGFETIAQSAASPYAAIANHERNLFGLQFHPEVTHTPQGQQIIQRFIHDVCQCSPLWVTDSIIQDLVNSIREKVGSDKVVLGLSGGVDSSVCAALVQQAIGDNLTCIFVDNGLLRLNEAETVYSEVIQQLGVKAVCVDASDRFYRALAGVDDPETKRKIIGRIFIDIFQEEAEKIEAVSWLAQGTIYPDVIESAGAHTGQATVIKSHHNVGGLPETLHLKLLEPLRDLFKDEVRKIGVQLGLPHHLVYRHPFPGPGLGVRVVGEVRKEFVELLRRSDAIFIEELIKNDLYYKASQAFAVFLPVKSVGVVGDNRAYEHVINLRAVQTLDFMTANWMRIPFEILQLVSSRIVNEVPGISRVTYDISNKPPATIEWE